MKKNRPFQRSLALALSMVMVLGGMPVPASANVLPSETQREIISFESLAEETEYQSVPIGTKAKELDLPKNLVATVELKTNEENPSEIVEEPAETSPNETPTEGGIQEPQESNESENPDATSSNALRADSVRVDFFDENDPEITDVQETQVVEKVISIPVTWSAEPEFESDVAGDYIFLPTIPDEYVIADGVDLPAITVSVGNMMLRSTGNGWYERTTNLDLTATAVLFQDINGNPAGANPRVSDITITGEGWYWYLTGYEAKGYPEKTLVLDGINFDINSQVALTLPAGTTIVLEDDTNNYVNNSYTNSSTPSYGILTSELKIKGSGCLNITAGYPNGVGGVGILSFFNFFIGEAEVYINLIDPEGQENNTVLTNGNDPGIKVYQKSKNGDYSIEAVWNTSLKKYTYNDNNTVANDVKLVNGTYVKRTATISDKTVSGREGKTLSGDNDVTISILNDTFIELQENDNISNWFSNLPIGLTASVKSISSESVTIGFSGIPTVQSNEVMNITIPGDYLTNGMLPVTVNNNAKFNITGIHPRTSTLDLTGEVLSYVNTSGDIVDAFPITNDIINTSEGWTWFLHEDEVTGYPAKTLVLDGLNLHATTSVGIKLPPGATILLADGSYNSAMAVTNVIDSNGEITIKGSGELFAQGTGAVSAVGIRSTDLTIEDGIVRVLIPSANIGWVIYTDNLNITGGTIYLKSSNNGYAANFKELTSSKELTVLQKIGDDYSEAARIENDGYSSYYVYGTGTRANDLRITIEQTAPTGSVGSKIVSGMTNTALSGHDFITVTLDNETYNNLNEGEVVSGWFQNLPEGITASLEKIDSDQVVTIGFSGMPIAGASEAINMVIPANKLTSGNALSVASNMDARFDIVQAGVRTTALDLTTDSVWYRNLNGELVNKNPRKDDINDTAEGWAWYHSNHELILSGINLICSESIGINLPEGTRVLLADNRDNSINILDREDESSNRGIFSNGDIEMSGNTGMLHVTTGNTNGYHSTGIYTIGILTISGGNITAIAGDAYYSSFGIGSETGIDITSGSIYAKSSSVSDSNGIAAAIHARYGITDEGMEALQKVEGDYTEPAIVRNNSNISCMYVFAGDNIASDIKLTTKAVITNAGGSANITFNGTTIDLRQLSPLFTVDKNAGNRIYAVEEDGTGAGTISGSILTVTKSGTIRISLATEKTQTHPAGAKVFAVLTVKKGEKTSSPAHLSVINATKNGGADGKITGLNPNTMYEYKKDGVSYKEVTSNERGEITGLSSGSYVVRFAENELYGASSDSAAIFIGQPDVNNGGNTGGNNGGNSGGSGNDSSSLPTQAITGAAQSTADVDSKGNAVVSVSDKNITDAIANARANAAKRGVNAGDITVSINVSTGGKDASAVTVNLPKNIQQQVISNKISSVELMIDRPDITLGINLAAVTEINKQANADVQLTAKKVDSSTLRGAAKNQIGSRPVYDLKASYQGGTKQVTNFGDGSVFVSIPYTLTSDEAIGGLYAVYVDEQGNPTRVEGSAYDSNSKSVIFKTNHFSVYGLGYESPAAKLTDTSGHWAKDSIDYVVNRGLISGISETVFSPDHSVTRGTLATALGRLAAIDVKAYTNNSFADVKADNGDRPYIEWANEKGIISNKGNNHFAPDQTVTREEAAAILANYAKATGYKLPEVRSTIAFADGAKIESGYQEAVAAMQKAGVIISKEGNSFSPKANASLGEVSSMLHRYIKLTINPVTAQNWAKSDSGQYMYFKEGNAVTDWQTMEGVKYYFSNNGIMVSGKWLEIEGNWYYFNPDGSLARNTNVDGYDIDDRGVRK